MNKRAHLMHQNPEIVLAEQAYIKFIQPKNHPTLDTLGIKKLIQSTLMDQSNDKKSRTSVLAAC